MISTLVVEATTDGVRQQDGVLFAGVLFVGVFTVTTHHRRGSQRIPHLRPGIVALGPCLPHGPRGGAPVDGEAHQTK